MPLSAFLYVLLGLFTVVVATHFRGSHMWWRPSGAAPSQVTIRYRIGWRRSYDENTFCDQTTITSLKLIGPADAGNLKCRRNCEGNVGSLNYRCTDFSEFQDWSLGVNAYDYIFPGLDYYEISWKGRGWLDNLVQGGDSDWELRMAINLTTRSDTGQINRSPSSAMSPIVRLQRGCNNTIRIPTEDPDGDDVRCRWAMGSRSECGGVCNAFLTASIDQRRCLITFPWYGMAGWYAVAVQLEDFPRQSDSQPLSAVPLQFLVEVYDANISCSSKPTFIAPSPPTDLCYGLAVGEPFRLDIVARTRDLFTRISEINTVSIPGMSKSPLQRYGTDPRDYSVVITWTPTREQLGQKIFCFTAVDNTSVSSDQRCINLVVGGVAPKPTGVSVGSDGDRIHVTFDKEIRKTMFDSTIRIYSEDGTEVQRSDAKGSDVMVSDRILTVVLRDRALLRGRFYVLMGDGSVQSTDSCGIVSVKVTDPRALTYFKDSTTLTSTSPATAASSSTVVPLSTRDPGSCDFSYLKVFYVWYEDIDFCLDVQFINRPSSVWGIPWAMGPARRTNGVNQEIRISSPEFRNTCYGRLDLCQNGFAVTLWLRVENDASRVILNSQGDEQTDQSVLVEQIKGQGLSASLFTGSRTWTINSGRENFRIDSWNHVAVVWSPQAGAMMYINGRRTGSDAVKTTGSQQRQGYVFRIGNPGGNSQQYVQLQMQDLRFFQRWLTRENINDLFNQGHVYGFTRDPIYWPVEPFPDPPNYIYRGDPLINPGLIGNGITFDGINQQVTLGDYAGQCLGDPDYCPEGFTVSFWMKPGSINRKQCVIANGGDDDRHLGFAICFQPEGDDHTVSGVVRTRTSVWESGPTAVDIHEDIWNHVLLTWHPTKHLHVYINGVRSQTDGEPRANNVTPDNTNNALVLGAYNNGQHRADVSLDEVYFWERFMDPEEIKRLYDSGFHYQFPMDKITGSKLEAEKDATTNNGPSITTGVHDGAIELKPNQNVLVDNDRNACFGNLDLCPNGYTVSLWLRLENASCSRYIYSNGGQSVASHGVALSYQQGTGLVAYAKSTSKQWRLMANTSPPIRGGTWYHVVMVWSDYDGLRLFVNGTLVGQQTTPQSVRTFNVAFNDFYLGKSNADDTLPGCKTTVWLDDMKVWGAEKFPQSTGEPLTGISGPPPSSEPVSEAQMATNDLTWLIYVVAGIIALVALLTIIALIVTKRRTGEQAAAAAAGNAGYSEKKMFSGYSTTGGHQEGYVTKTYTATRDANTWGNMDVRY